MAGSKVDGVGEMGIQVEEVEDGTEDNEGEVFANTSPSLPSVPSSTSST